MTRTVTLPTYENRSLKSYEESANLEGRPLVKRIPDHVFRESSSYVVDCSKVRGCLLKKNETRLAV